MSLPTHDFFSFRSGLEVGRMLGKALAGAHMILETGLVRVILRTTERGNKHYASS